MLRSPIVTSRSESSTRSPRLLSRAPIERIRGLSPARRSEHGAEAGQTIVEFALILPLLLVFLFLIIDFGKALNYWVDTTHLASEGARLAAVDRIPSGSTSLQSYIKSRADSSELEEGLIVCVDYPTTRNVGEPVTVTVSDQYEWVPFIGSKFKLSEITIKGSATHRLERIDGTGAVDESANDAGCS